MFTKVHTLVAHNEIFWGRGAYFAVLEQSRLTYTYVFVKMYYVL